MLRHAHIVEWIPIYRSGMKMQEDMNNVYQRAWGDLVPSLAQATRRAPSALTFLHLPKSGGSTVGISFDRSLVWDTVRLPWSAWDGATCECGSTEGCVDHSKIEHIRDLENKTDRGNPFFIKLAHENYQAVQWLHSRIQESGGSLNRSFTTVRPIRNRLVSMFMDYWTQVSRIQSPSDIDLKPHVERMLQAYEQDAKHYLDESGYLNGIAWFRAFAEHGGGVPFFLSEVFESPDELAAEVASGRLEVIPTREIDNVISNLTGINEIKRQRVSTMNDNEAVLNAIAEAGELIESLAARDTEYETVLVNILGKDRFGL